MKTDETPQTVPENPKARCVLDAALEIFSEVGYETASMDRVAQAAGVSKATVYAHFQSKERLFAAVVGRQCQRNARTLVDDDVLKQPVDEALRTIGMHFLGILLSPRALRMFRVVAAESYRFPELGKIFFDSGPLATSQALRDYFRLASEREELAVPDPALAAEQFLSVIRGHLHLRCLLGLEDRPPESEMRRLVDEAVTLFCRGYSTHR